ncbi:ABC transporter permease [Caldimonas tepidiphila]|uniref:ABC transporter permease n=1 Tax=Caldimonas tepidiphila TaxID=2315841 RepID=UPI000E5C206D|nr:ABC transporter permease [Caldimonas tepidiphila]
MRTPPFSTRRVWHLGLKELASLWRERLLLVFVLWAFFGAVYVAASGHAERLQRVPVAVVDEDQSVLSQRIVSAFYPPAFKPPELITLGEMDAGMDAGRYTFVLDIPPGFQRDVLAGRAPALQLNVDAKQMSQAFAGTGAVQAIVQGEIAEFARRERAAEAPPVELSLRMRFNPTLNDRWFMGLMELVGQITMLSIILTGAALIREREHGTLEHLLVMPVQPVEIVLGKIWSMGLVVLVAATLSLRFVVQGVLEMPLTGPLWLFVLGIALHLFATTSMGIYMGTVARSMPQLGLLIILVLLPLQMLSGASTPRESMPEIVRTVMLAAPTTHFVAFSQAVLYRGAGLAIVWPQLLAIAVIGAVFFAAALRRFRRSVATLQG